MTTTDRPQSGESAPEPEDLDPLDEFSEKLNAFKTFAKEDRDAADKLFESLGGRGKVEQEMLLQLGAWAPLYKADRFDDAHHVAMRALEVLYRNGHRKAPLKLGFLTPIGQYFVQLVTRLIVRDFVKDVTNGVYNLYMRRWTSSPKNTPDAMKLRRAWFHVEKVRETYKGRSLGLPTFLVGGAFLSSLTGVLRSIADARSNKWVFIVLAIIIYALLIAVAYGIIKGAAIARRRIKMSLDQPLRNLWEVVGAAGNPPKDQAIQFALIALIIMAITAVAIPIIAVAVFITN